MATVSSALLTQVGARALCVLGGLSAVEWRDAVADLPNAAVGAEVMRWMFVVVKLVGILVGITCWWHWRGLLRSIKAAPDRCAGCLYPTDQDRCPECGVVDGRESRGKSLAALQRLQSNHFAELWIFLAFLILIRIVGAGVFVGVPAISGAPYGAALRRWGDIAGGTTGWNWIEAPFVLVSLVLVARGLKTLRSCRGVASRR